jgi:hypothetical protein
MEIGGSALMMVHNFNGVLLGIQTGLEAILQMVVRSGLATLMAMVERTYCSISQVMGIGGSALMMVHSSNGVLLGILAITSIQPFGSTLRS